MQNPTSRLISSAQMKNLIEQFKLGGYDVKAEATVVEVRLDDELMFWGMAHSSKKHWLTRYNSRLLSEAA